jgi:aminoglycoside phosphotransferase (APT) family kinase protein
VALLWGDARMGNLIFDDDLGVVAVLDWELAALGDPEIDLGWWVFMMRFHTEGMGVPVPSGFPGRDDVVVRYQELTGRPVRNLDYFELLAGVRVSSVLMRVAHLMKSAGALPPDSPMALHNPGTAMLAKLLGIPLPQGPAQTFVGNR